MYFSVSYCSLQLVTKHRCTLIKQLNYPGLGCLLDVHKELLFHIHVFILFVNNRRERSVAKVVSNLHQLVLRMIKALYIDQQLSSRNLCRL